MFTWTAPCTINCKTSDFYLHLFIFVFINFFSGHFLKTQFQLFSVLTERRTLRSTSEMTTLQDHCSLILVMTNICTIYEWPKREGSFSLAMIGRNIRQVKQSCRILLISWNFGKTQLSGLLCMTLNSHFKTPHVLYHASWKQLVLFWFRNSRNSLRKKIAVYFTTQILQTYLSLMSVLLNTLLRQLLIFVPVIDRWI